MVRLVLHADDVGMCHGANVAFRELSALGTISAGSVMVPCPWSSEILEAAAADPTLDLGVHLTSTSEHHYYRWGPVGAHSRASGLVDDDGYLWPTVAEVRRYAAPGAVEVEWREQIERALSAGVDITHLDAHMGTALAPEFAERYVALGLEYRVPALLTTTLAAYDPNDHLVGVREDEMAPALALATAASMPLFDRVLQTDFARPRGAPCDHPAQISAGVDGLGDDCADGLVYAAFHPCRPGPGEIEVIEPEQHHVRTDEYRMFAEPGWAEWITAQDLAVVGMRELRDEWRVGASPAGGW